MNNKECIRHASAKIKLVEALNNIARETGLGLMDILYVTESVCSEQRLNFALAELAEYEKELSEMQKQQDQKTED